MATENEEKVRCRRCGGENVKLTERHEEEQYGYDTEGAGVGRTYLGTATRRNYYCDDCRGSFTTVEIER